MKRHPQYFTLYGIILTLLLCLFCLESKGQVVEARAVLDTNQALLGDQLGLNLVLEKPDDVTVDFPEIGEDLSDAIAVVGKSSIDTSMLPDGMERLTQKLTIAVFDTGMVKVPPLAFHSQSEAFSDTIETTPAYINILPLQLDEDIRDIKSNYHAPVTLIEVLPYALVLILIILLVYFIRRYYVRRFGRLQVALSNLSLDPPDVTAIRELEKLKKEAPWHHHSIKPNYIRLSEVLRNYIEQQFRVPALEQTTGEILASLRKSNGGAENLRILEQVLSLADLVKFAKVIPGQHENNLQVDLAMEYVKKSRPVLPADDAGRPENTGGTTSNDERNPEEEPETVNA